MGKKILLGGAAVLLAVAAVAVWQTPWPRATSDDPPSGIDAAGLSAEAAPVKPSAVASSAERMEVQLPELLPPVDFGTVDRDLDLFGLVVDSAGEPIAGALVEGIEFPGRRVTILHPDAQAIAAVTKASSRTAEDGSFLLRLSRGDFVHLRVRHESYATQEVPDCLAGEKVRVVLADACRLEIVAVDQESLPIPDVQVRYFQWHPSVNCDERTGTTDADGRVRFENVPPGFAVVDLTHPSFAGPARKGVTIDDSGLTAVEVTIRPGKTIRGRVTDATTGMPIEGALIGSSWTVSRRVRTDESGRYTFRCSANWAVNELHVIHSDYGRMGMEVPASGVLDFELIPGDRARGRLLSAEGKPVEGALITAVGSDHVRGQHETDTRSGMSDDDGRFELTGLRRDMPHTLVVQACGARGASGYGRLLLDFAPHPGEPGLIDLGEIELAAGRNIEGIVVNAAGEPQASQPVTLTGHNADRGRLRPEAKRFAVIAWYGNIEKRRTDDLGRFRFPGLSPGNYEVTLADEERTPVSRRVRLPPDHDVTDVTLVTGTGKALNVLVLDSAGTAVENAHVRIDFPVWSRSVSRRSDGSGRVTFSQLPPIASTLSVSATGYSSPRSQRIVPSGQELRLVLFESANLSGVVLGPAGEPLPHLYVQSLVDGKGYYSDFTDEQGRFEISGPRGQSQDLVVSGRRRIENDKIGRTEWTPFRGELRGLVAPTSDLVIRVGREPFDQSLIVVVEGPGGEPFPGALVNVIGNGFDFRAPVKANDEGVAIIEKLPRSPVEASANNMGSIESLEQLMRADDVSVVPEGQRITLRLHRVALMIVQTVDGEQEPVSRALVNVTSSEGFVGVFSTDASGHSSWWVLPDQIYSLSATAVTPELVEIRGAVEGVVPGGGEVRISMK